MTQALAEPGLVGAGGIMELVRAYGAAKMSIGFAAGAKERAEAEDRASAAHRAVHAALHAAVPA